VAGVVNVRNPFKS